MEIEESPIHFWSRQTEVPRVVETRQNCLNGLGESLLLSVAISYAREDLEAEDSSSHVVGRLIQRAVAVELTFCLLRTQPWNGAIVWFGGSSHLS